MKFALSAKLIAKDLIILDDAKLSEAKTAMLAAAMTKLGATNALVIGGAALDENFAKAARNIPNLDVLPVQGVTVYDILRRRKLVLTKEAVESINGRLGSETGAAA